MKKFTILFIQGGGAGAHEVDKKLASYLKDNLGKAYSVNYPTIPNENDPDYEAYKIEIDKELKRINGSEVILAAHSVGGTCLLKYLSEEKIDKDIAGIFLISTPFWGEGGWQYEGFTLNNASASKSTINIPIFFYHSTADETVPSSHLELYAEKFPHATIRKIVGRGHQLENNLSEVVRDIKSLGAK